MRAGRPHVRHGGWIAVTSASLSLVFLAFPAEGPVPEVPLWYDMVGWALLLPAGLAGGGIAAFLSGEGGLGDGQY
jgi:hypothetical protein